jgi:hypothetical protein
MSEILQKIDAALDGIRTGISTVAEKIGVPMSAVCEVTGNTIGDIAEWGTELSTSSFLTPYGAGILGSGVGSVAGDLTTSLCLDQPINPCEVFGNAAGSMAGTAANPLGDFGAGALDGAVGEGAQFACESIFGSIPESTTEFVLEEGQFNVFVPSGSGGGSSGGVGGGGGGGNVLIIEENKD